MSESPPPPADSSEAREYNALTGMRVVPGRKAVIAMFGFASLMVALLFVYWELYTRPFRPLQNAIAAEFPESSPCAVGGRVKSHLPGSPSILRLIIRIPWDPRDDESRDRETANRLYEIAGDTIELDQYERMEIILEHRRPERSTISWWLDAPRTEFPLPVEGPLPPEVKITLQQGVEGS